MKSHQRFIPLLLSVGLALLGLWAVQPDATRSAPGPLFVSPGGSGTACTQAQPCTLPIALAQAIAGDTVYLTAGTYTGAGEAIATITQSLTLYGGWDGAASGPVGRDPVAYSTTLDGEGARRGVYASGDITVTLEGFTVTNGTALDMGAGLYAQNAHLTLREMTFYSNVISTTTTGSPSGGGAAVEGGTLLVEACTFRANSVWAKQGPFGGGLAISATLAATVLDSLFQDNDAWIASGLSFIGAGSSPAPLTVRGNHFLDNGWGNSPGIASGGYSAALEIVDADAQVIDNQFAHNQASNGWGTVSVLYATLNLARNLIYDNTSFYDASGLYLHSVSPFTVTNNLIVDNQSTYYWTEHQAVHIRDGAGLLLHNTIARNDNTYGVWIDKGATVTLTNTILVSHTVGISVTNGSTATLEATLWGTGDWGNGSDWGGEGSIVTGTVNIWGLPNFVNPDGGDYHLGPGSRAIDSGVDASVTDDIDGDPRPQCLGYDIGADEFRGWRLYLPLVLH
jgi:hypothetical protein